MSLDLENTLGPTKVADSGHDRSCVHFTIIWMQEERLAMQQPMHRLVDLHNLLIGVFLWKRGNVAPH
jgi:hypothetical protein